MRCTALFLFALLGSGVALAGDDLLVADFEGDSYTPWQVEGEAFGTRPARGTLPGQMTVEGFVGRGLVNSFYQGDRTTGTLTSPPFKLERRYLTFLMGGGGHADETYMCLLVDGKPVRTATGPNTQPGGSEELQPQCWDVGPWVGQTATLQIVDHATGGWGHINVDHIVQTDMKPKLPVFEQREASFVVENRYLVMPIHNGKSRQTELQLYVDGQEVRRYTLNLATSPETTDWYAYFTLDEYQGKSARVVVMSATEEGFALVKPSNSIPGEDQFYREPHRPQFHFTQKVGWNNDPNGMVYHDGTWHLYFQYNPVSMDWGNMTWGHTTSPDLVHWQQQPNALFPRTMTKGDCYSGGATVDHQNTAGWGRGALVAFLTDTEAGESVAYSTDGGKTLTLYEGNPVVKHQGRDPKVIWYAYDADDEPLDATAKQLGGHWVMAVYDEHPEHDRNIAFYTSTNLKDWTEQSHLPGYFECPELFELPIDGDASQTRWVVFAADANYCLGTFDGKQFVPEWQDKQQLHWGPYYAAQTFDNAPDGRRIQIGWLRMDAAGPFNQFFSFPHELTLRTTADGVRMFAEPVAEIKTLRCHIHKQLTQRLAAGTPATMPVGSDLLDVRVKVELGTTERIELALPGRTVTYDAVAQRLNDAPLAPVDGCVEIRVLADRSITEVIGNGGRVVVSGPGPAKLDATAITVTAHGGEAKLLSFEADELKSIWSQD